MNITRKFIRREYPELCNAFGTSFTLAMARELRDYENKFKVFKKKIKKNHKQTKNNY